MTIPGTEVLSRTPVADAVSVEVADNSAEVEVRAGLADLQRDTILDLMDAQKEIAKRWEALGQISDEEQRIREQAILESESIVLTQSIKQREKDTAELAYALLALHGDLSIETGEKKKPTSEDLDLIAKAEKALADEEGSLDTIKQRLKTAEEEKGRAKVERSEAQGSWQFWAKKAMVASAQAKVEAQDTIITAGPEAVERVHEAINVARKGVLEANAQVQININQRVREASLQESFKTLRTLSQAIVTEFRSDSEATAKQIVSASNAYTSALNRKQVVAVEQSEVDRDLRDVEDLLVIHRQTLSEIMDIQSPEYATQQIAISEHEETQRALNSRKQVMVGQMASLSAGIVAMKGSIEGMHVQKNSADMMAEKVETSEKSARVVAAGIDQMIKNSKNETIADAIDRTNDSAQFQAVALAAEAQVASAKAANAAYARHVAQMEKLENLGASRDEGMAAANAEFAGIDIRARARYEKEGRDVSGTFMAGLAQEFIEAAKTDTSDEITF